MLLGGRATSRRPRARPNGSARSSVAAAAAEATDITAEAKKLAKAGELAPAPLHFGLLDLVAHEMILGQHISKVVDHSLWPMKELPEQNETYAARDAAAQKMLPN